MLSEARATESRGRSGKSRGARRFTEQCRCINISMELIETIANDVQYLRTKLDWACQAIGNLQQVSNNTITSNDQKAAESTTPPTKSKLNGYLTGALGYRGIDQAGRTPDALLEHLNAEFDFDFDPCPQNPDFDGLSVDWGSRNYVNPPYNDIGPWVAKALAERDKTGATSVFLIPFRPHTKYFRDLILPNASEIRFFRHKFAFKGYKRAAIAVSLTIFRPLTSVPRELTDNCDFRFNLLQLRDTGGGFTAANVVSKVSGWFLIEQTLQDIDDTSAIDETRDCLIVTNQKPRMFIEHAETLFKLHGKTIVLILPFRIESSYFMDKIMFGTALHILAINPTISTAGFANRSPTGSVVLVWTHKEIPALYRPVGFKLGIIEENFNHRNELSVK